MRVRVAVPEDAPILSLIARAAKAHWGYDEAQLMRWDQELTISQESLLHAPSFVAEIDGAIAGFVQLDMNAQPPLLDHLWVDPACMGLGAGRALLRHAQTLLAAQGVCEMAIDADPHAEGFYVAMGARRVGVVPAPIPGDAQRIRPQLRLDVSSCVASVANDLRE